MRQRAVDPRLLMQKTLLRAAGVCQGFGAPARYRSLPVETAVTSIRQYASGPSLLLTRTDPLIPDELSDADDPTPARGSLTGQAAGDGYSDGGAAKAGPAGSRSTAFGTGSRANRAYLLVTARLEDGEEPCRSEVVPVQRDPEDLQAHRLHRQHEWADRPPARHLTGLFPRNRRNDRGRSSQFTVQ